MRRDWTFIAVVAALTLVAAVRVASTHRIFSVTIDEPAHLGDGDRWFDGRYAGDTLHPPLARVLCALPLRIAGVPPPSRENEIARGHEVLAYGGNYDARLAVARRGNLVLLAVAIAATAAWARRAFSRGTAMLAAAIFTALPPVLGHAGLITTDMALTATLPLALLALDMALERPSFARWLALGGAIGLGLLAKLSFLVYFPPAALVVFAVRRQGRHFPMRGIAVAALTAFFVLWAGYRFSFAKPSDFSKDAVFLFHHAAPEPLVPLARMLAQTPMPAPVYALGIATLGWRAKNVGHPSYFLGEESTTGWWHYFPVLLFFKSPLPFLIFVAWGAIFLRSREQLAYALAALAILLVAMTSSLNLGIRHILPIYAPLSIVAAHGVMEIRRRASGAFSHATLIALLAWLFVGPALAHPDYLAWFNELAGENPAWIAVDSNLDWGQDAGRLVRTARELNIDTLHVALMAAIRFEQYGVRAELLEPYTKKSGWIAVSETVLAMEPARYRWLSVYRPMRRIGKSIRLYHIPHLRSEPPEVRQLPGDSPRVARHSTRVARDLPRDARESPDLERQAAELTGDSHHFARDVRRLARDVCPCRS